ncbi:S-adenosyl-L-methionine-dependent methyltransferase [Panaeolus papilionaceus]|nr:S-adenosyl-L-methionine-dependent methyltransferase [Panaeolus papilionaceus]
MITAMVMVITTTHHGLEHHEHDFVACNKEYYDKNVDKYDNPHWVAANKKQALAIRDAFNFDKEMTTVLDFACGAGTLARELAPYAKSIIGVDISPVAIDEFNAKAAEAGHGPDVLRGICTELKGEEGELDGAKFDLVTCCAAYHHFSDYNKVTTILAKFLKPGGMLCVLDRLAGTDHEVAAHGAHHEKGPAEEVDLERVVPHRHGIVSDDLLPGFQEAGLKDYTFEPSFDAEWMGMGFKIFLAKGIKPAE